MHRLGRPDNNISGVAPMKILQFQTQRDGKSKEQMDEGESER